ncbi:protein GAMETE EXPRESSED 3 [Nymphaea colorata]|nr:protein GAMETE EXPRESSED 3 [Nymphaea colorata]XP_031483719.1 protein GAMETE EXPRESSED 3 [Nymphaea colorata]
MVNPRKMLMFPIPIFIFLALSLSILGDEVIDKLSRLSKPLVGDDERIYTCAGKNFFAFESNGIVAWRIQLSYVCHTDIAPAFDSTGRIHLIAEDRVLTIVPPKNTTSKPVSKIFFGPGMPLGVSGEIVGFAISIWAPALFITIANSGIYAFRLDGTSLWSAGPAFYQSIYPQACWNNLTTCSFALGPIIDECEASIYAVNSEGQVYSISSLKPFVNWVQDFGAIDKMISLTAGNNGLVYLVFPRKSLVMALDASEGTVLWRDNVGPLSVYACSLLIDSTGWVSIGSLDGFVYSFSPTGIVHKNLEATAVDSVIQVDPALDCAGRLVYAAQLKVASKSSHLYGDYSTISVRGPLNLIFTLFVPATGAVHWTGEYPGQLSSTWSSSYLRHFVLDARVLLAFVTAANLSKSSSCHTSHEKLRWRCSHARSNLPQITYTSDEKKMFIFLGFQFVVLIVLAGFLRFCCIFWGKKKLRDQDLNRFLSKRRSLRTRKKAFDKIISELEEKASADPIDEQVLERLNHFVQEREAIERKLSSTYNFSSDGPELLSDTILPLHQGELGHGSSFSKARRGSMAIFDTLSTTSSDEKDGGENCYDGYKGSAAKLKQPLEVEKIHCDNSWRLPRMASERGEHWEPTPSSSGSAGFTNPLFDDEPQCSAVRSVGCDEHEGNVIYQRLHGNGCLKRRRSTNSAG